MNPSPDTGIAPLNPADVVELQDQLLEAATDLERLSLLLDDAAAQLMGRFSAADAQLGAPAADNDLRESARRELAGAVTALQFQDMAAQILTHTVTRIRVVADFLGTHIDNEDGVVPAPLQLVQRHCPVMQREVEAGSIELF